MAKKIKHYLVTMSLWIRGYRMCGCGDWYKKKDRTEIEKHPIDGWICVNCMLDNYKDL